MQTEVRQSIRPSIQQPAKDGIYRRYFKKPMDFILALCTIIVLSPVFLIVGILVRVKLDSPVISKQNTPVLMEIFLPSINLEQ